MKNQYIAAKVSQVSGHLLACLNLIVLRLMVPLKTLLLAAEEATGDDLFDEIRATGGGITKTRGLLRRTYWSETSSRNLQPLEPRKFHCSLIQKLVQQ